MGVKYKIKLASPGELSGQLVIAGSANYSPAPPPDTSTTAILHSFMGNEADIRAHDPEIMENLRVFNAQPVPARVISECGNKNARMIHLGSYSPPEHYDVTKTFSAADIAVVERKPVIKFFSKPGNAWNEGPRMFGIPCYIKEIFERYEADYRKGKLSLGMIWHVEKKGDFLLYWLNTRRLERARRKVKRVQEKDGYTGSLEFHIAKLEEGMRVKSEEIKG